jgi:phage tail-like protein
MGLLQNTTKPDGLIKTPLAALKDIEEYPIPIYQFSIVMDGEVVALFQSISGMNIKREVVPLTEGGKNDATHEFAGQVSYEHITFESGLTSSDFFWKWMMDGAIGGYVQKKDFDLIQRRPNPNYSDGAEIWEVAKTWNFINAFPVSWKISDLALEDSEKIVMESLELTFDYFTLGQNVFKPKAP